MAAPTSTYRLQLRPAFGLHAAAASCDYLATLGVGGVYLSPLLPSVRGSEHGYDVVGYQGVDPQRGGLDGWTRLLAAGRSRALRVVVDIVPNHTGVEAAEQNHAWWDVLKRGRDSPFAPWFDIDWSAGPILLPVLGDDFSPDQLRVDGESLSYHEHRYPLAPGTEPNQGEDAAAVHERQHYRLVNHRRANVEHSYRRFFAVSALAGLRVEDEAVFDATHAQIGRWVREDGVEGLRVDHPDGLADPLGYLTRLRALAGPQSWLVVEKILEPGEQLPQSWPVDGTTGYDALAEVGALLLDPAAEHDIDALYRELTGDDAEFAEHAEQGKRLVATTILHPEVARLAALAPGVAHAVDAVVELLVAFPVYRSYLPDGAEYLSSAISGARASRPDITESIDALAVRLAEPAEELCVRFQQTSGAVMAKGVEDTAFYRYNRFIALNEVGGNPARFGCEPDQFHDAQVRRQAQAPRAMTTLSTHDTKRGEDVRARLAVLAELPHEWAELARALMAATDIDDAGFAYALWQTFAGAGFIDRERMHAYAHKAMREAGARTSWIDPQPRFEQAVHATVDRAYDDPLLHAPLAAFVERITPYGWLNSLAQKLIQLTMPGVPDVYQGTELWEDSLVDPDNRRPVDLDARFAMLDALDADGQPPPVDATGRAKLWITARALRLRRDWPGLFDRYVPVPVEGPAARHAVAYDRGGAITVATRLPVGLERGGGWRQSTVDLAGSATDVLTGESYQGAVDLAVLLDTYPVALLVR